MTTERKPGEASVMPSTATPRRERPGVKWRPLHDRVLVRRLEPEEKTAGGIIDTAKEKPMEGMVVAVGPGARGEDGKLHPLDVKLGDRVLFGKAGTEIMFDGEALVIMKESEIMNVLDGWSRPADADLEADEDEPEASAMDAVLARLDKGIAAEHAAMDRLLDRILARARHTASRA